MRLIKACKCGVNTKNTISNELIMFAVNVRKKKIVGNSKNKDNDRQIFVFVCFFLSQTKAKHHQRKKEWKKEHG